mgnify:FL=1
MEAKRSGEHIDSGACTAKQTENDRVRNVSRRATRCRQSAGQFTEAIDPKSPISTERVDIEREYTSIEVCDVRLTKAGAMNSALEEGIEM